MRFLRIPIVSEDAQQLPDWVIGDLNREPEERREAPRLELPDQPPRAPQPRAPEPERSEGGTVIVFDI